MSSVISHLATSFSADSSVAGNPGPGDSPRASRQLAVAPPNQIQKNMMQLLRYLQGALQECLILVVVEPRLETTVLKAYYNIVDGLNAQYYEQDRQQHGSGGQVAQAASDPRPAPMDFEAVLFYFQQDYAKLSPEQPRVSLKLARMGMEGETAAQIQASNEKRLMNLKKALQGRGIQCQITQIGPDFNIEIKVPS